LAGAPHRPQRVQQSPSQLGICHTQGKYAADFPKSDEMLQWAEELKAGDVESGWVSKLDTL